MKSNYLSDPFFQVPRVNVNTSAGEVEFPIFYYDTSNLIAIFKGDSNGVNEILKDKGLTPAMRMGKSPLVFMSFYEYRHTSIGSYNEVGIAIPVLREGRKKPFSTVLELFQAVDKRQAGFYVVDLPVSTEAACAAGKEMWGFPKFVTNMPYQHDKKMFDCEIQDPTEGSIARLSGKLKLGMRTPALSAVFFSQLNGDLLRSSVNVRGHYTSHVAHGLKLKVGESQHVMAQHLRTLGLSDSRPLMVMSCLNFQSRLNLGVAV